MGPLRLPLLTILITAGSILGVNTEPLRRVVVESWERPSSGWLYVVDPGIDGTSRIWLFDADRGRIRGTIHAGYDPDIAISPDGNRLYVASTNYGCGSRNCDELTVIDTANGKRIGVSEIPDRVQYKVYPSSSWMTVSADGRFVYVLKWQGIPSGETPVGLAVFDARLGRFRSEEIDLGRCGDGRFVAVPQPNEFAFHCSESNEIRVYELLTPWQAVLRTAVQIPRGQRSHAGFTYSDVPVRAFMPCSKPDEICAVAGDGAVYALDLTTQTVTRTAIAGDQTEMVSPLAWPASVRPARLYVGIGACGVDGLAGEVRVFDTDTWARTDTIRTSTRFCSAVANRDGSMIYALTREHASILTIDAVNGREVQSMPLGRVPSLALVAP